MSAITKVLTLLTLASMAYCGCAHTQPVTDGVVYCAEKATRDTALGLIDDVATALVTQDWKGSLVFLVSRWGNAAISCAVAEVADSSQRNARVSGDQLEDMKAQRARAWLAEHPVVMPQ